MSADAVSVPPATSGKPPRSPASSSAVAVSPASVATLTPGRYWVGLKDGAPRETIQFGGIAFPRTTYTERPNPEKDGVRTYDVPRDGDYLDLYEDDLQRLLAARGKKVARFVSAQSGMWRIYDKGTLGYRSMPNDKPLEEFLLLRRLRDTGIEGRDIEGRYGDVVCLKDVA